MSDKLNLYTLVETYSDQIAAKCQKKLNISPEDAQKQAKTSIVGIFYKACGDELTVFQNKNNREYAEAALGAIALFTAFGSLTGFLDPNYGLPGAIAGLVIGALVSGAGSKDVQQKISSKEQELKQLKEQQFASSGKMDPNAPDCPKVYKRAEQLLRKEFKLG